MREFPIFYVCQPSICVLNYFIELHKSPLTNTLYGLFVVLFERKRCVSFLFSMFVYLQYVC
jgi:hypothetical protein